MGEEELTVRVVPEIDDEAISDISAKLSDMVATVSGTVGGGSSTSSSSEAVADTKTDEGAVKVVKDGAVEAVKELGKNPDTVATAVTPITNNQKEATKITAGMDETTKENLQTSKESKSIFTQMFEGVAVAYGMAKVGWGVLEELFNIVKKSAGPLDSVIGMFDTLFGMFLAPLNIALSQILVPYVQELAGTMGQWVSEMMGVYKEGGLGALITQTFGKLVAVFGPLLIKMVNLSFQMIGTFLNSLMKSGPLGSALVVIGSMLPGLYLAFTAFKLWQNAKLTKMAITLDAIFGTCLSREVKDNMKWAMITPLIAPILAAALAVVAIFEAISFLTTGKGLFQNLFGFAKGGTFAPNDPRVVMVGDNTEEEEIIAPKSTIVSAVNEALTNNSVNSYSSSSSMGGTVINATFNITGSNAEEIAEQVEKQLSRIMDRSNTQWGT